MTGNPAVNTEYLAACLKLVLLCWAAFFLTGKGAAQPFREKSVLAEGDFYKLGIAQPGIYRIDYAWLQELGLATKELNPHHLRLYTHRGGMLPQSNAAPAVDDLVEIPVQLIGGEDSIFDEHDYLLFYAQGPDETTYDVASGLFNYRKNLYDTLNYVFLRLSESPGLRHEKSPSLIYGNALTVDEYVDYAHHEKDLANLLQSGREWYGEELWEEQPDLDIYFNLPGLQGFRDMQVKLRAASKATSPAEFTLAFHHEQLGRLPIPAAQASTFGYKARVKEEVFSTRLLYRPDSLLHFRLSYQGGGFSGYLDHIAVQATRSLKLYGVQTAFRAPASLESAITEYRLATPEDEDLLIWDVTDPLRPAQQLYTSWNGGIRFKVFNNHQLREYIVFRGDASLPRPAFIQKVKNQNLHALSTPELLIISPRHLLAEAHRLAAFRQQHDGLRAEVVPLHQVYNEFASGRQDVAAIRNFIRMLYLREASLRYVLLFGDASYDYLERVSGNSNQVPTYQSYTSTHDVHSYASDDFFSFLDEEEGEWPESGSMGETPHLLDIGIGRLPVSTTEEAAAVVDKLIGYASKPETLGQWRSRLLFVADDGDDNKHLLMSDLLASQTASTHPHLLPQRLFMDAFPQENGRAPAMKAMLRQQVEEGVLLVDFIGHGGETAWTNEQILEADEIPDWNNTHRLPLFMTATCEFGRFDDPRRASGAEIALLHPAGGAIGLLTTTRPVFPGTNFKVSSAFYEHAFRPLPDGSPPRLGDIFRLTKNNSVSGNANRNFSLLGDPSMRLALPSREISFDRFRAETAQAADSLRPLQPFTLEARILQDSTGTDEDFTGTAWVSIYDQAREVTTLGDEGPETVTTFEQQESLLFRGKATVKKGRFRLSLLLPKNAEENYASLKVHAYAVHSSRMLDASGSSEKLRMGGEAWPTADRQPPRIRLFLNNRQFTDGSRVLADPILIVDLEDESGINITESGHGIIATLYGQPIEPFHLGRYFESEEDNFRKGQLSFPLKNLPPGKHQLSLEASDNALNRGRALLNFSISEDSVLIFSKIVTYPNPSPAGNMHLAFAYAPALPEARARLRVYDMQAHLVADEVYELPNEQAEYLIEWQGSQYSLRPGIYLYHLQLSGRQHGLKLEHRARFIVQ